MCEQPQTIILPLRLDALVYSGIAPPPQVLDRMAAARAGKTNLSSSGVAANGVASGGVTSSGFDEKPTLGANTAPTSHPVTDMPSEANHHAPPLPSRPGEAPYADAPPSYEDAIAEDLPPVDGYRPAYVQQPTGQDSLLHQDEKRGWH